MQTIDSLDNIREIIFRDYRVLVMGPNSLAAYLISVHMGFRTLALNERAGEIMNEFGKLKKEFEKFSGSTEDLMKKVDALQKSVNDYSTRERQMERAIDSMDKLDSWVNMSFDKVQDEIIDLLSDNLNNNLFF